MAPLHGIGIQSTWVLPRAATSPAPGPVDRVTLGAGSDFVPPRLCQVLAVTAARPEPSSPADMAGRWVGELKITGLPGYDRVGVDLEIRPRPDSPNLAFSLRYAGQPPRNYELIPVDPARGHYLLDEHNGILIDTFFKDGVLLSQFEVQGQRIDARYERQGERMLMEMTGYGTGPVRDTAGVKSFELRNLQRGVLQKVG